MSDNIEIGTSKPEILIFAKGQWFDSHGERVIMSDDEEHAVVSDVSAIESLNYSDVPGYISLRYSSTLEDIASYLECSKEDMYLFYRKSNTPSEGHKESKHSPSSKTSQYANTFYFLASVGDLNDMLYVHGAFPEAKAVEIADIAGHLSLSFMHTLFNSLISWMKLCNTKVFFCSCREDTSYKLLTNKQIKKHFAAKNFADIRDLPAPATEDGNTEQLDEYVNFHYMVFADIEWYNSLDDDKKRIVKSLTRGY